MRNEQIKQDVEVLKQICQLFEDNYFDDEFELNEEQKDELYRITGFEEHIWNEDNLAHFIDGMQRAIYLTEL